MAYVIPSKQWRDDVMLLRETLGLNFPEAWALLQAHGDPETAYIRYTQETSK